MFYQWLSLIHFASLYILLYYISLFEHRRRSPTSFFSLSTSNLYYSLIIPFYFRALLNVISISSLKVYNIVEEFFTFSANFCKRIFLWCRFLFFSNWKFVKFLFDMDDFQLIYSHAFKDVFQYLFENDTHQIFNYFSSVLWFFFLAIFKTLWKLSQIIWKKYMIPLVFSRVFWFKNFDRSIFFIADFFGKRTSSTLNFVTHVNYYFINQLNKNLLLKFWKKLNGKWNGVIHEHKRT